MTHRRRRQARRVPRLRLRMLQAELLEPRLTLSSDDVSWGAAANLTVSLAPDGTTIGEHRSELFAQFGVDKVAVWQEAVRQAFQTWAQHSNVNFGMVADDGSPFGTRGLAAGDLRFGDVRIGAVPMSSDTLAVSVDNNQGVAGTWAGDWLFNSLGEFSGSTDIYKVALHEIGHVLGLPHSTDPASPMFQHSANISSQLTAGDVADLQMRYGARQPDSHDAPASNDSLQTATRFANTDGGGNFPLETPWIDFGDLTTATDVDFYELRVPAGYQGTLTWQVRSAEISLLKPRVTLLDASGQVLAQQDALDPGGSVVSITQNLVTPGERYYAKVESATEDLFAIGSYAIVAMFDDRLTVDVAKLPGVVRAARRVSAIDDGLLNGDDYRQFFLDNFGSPVEDDGHTDDDVGQARELSPTVSTSRLTRYQVVASTNDGLDRDVFRLESPEFPRADSWYLHVAVESLELDQAIHVVSVTDHDGNVLPSELLANGDGTLVLQVSNIEPDRQYFVAVETAGADGLSRTGNFQMTAVFDAFSFQRQRFTSGELSGTHPESEFRLYVAKTQLFSFALGSETVPSDDAAIWMTIYNDHLRPLRSLASTLGTLRSASSMLLDPGEYLVQIGAKSLSESPLQTIPFTVWSKQVSDPIGPPVIDPTETPIYSCPSLPSTYCYPGDITSTQPTILVTPPIVLLPTLTATPITLPPTKWYWQVPVERTNVANCYDVNNDNKISPIDALVIINELNTNGSRAIPPPPVVIAYVDVNGDGFVSPLDVLVVINMVNATLGGTP